MTENLIYMLRALLAYVFYSSAVELLVSDKTWLTAREMLVVVQVIECQVPYVVCISSKLHLPHTPYAGAFFLS